MLAPLGRWVRGPLPKHTPVLVNALRALGVEVTARHWGRHHDQETLRDKVVGRANDIRKIVRLLRARRFDVLVVKTYHDSRALLRDVPLVYAARPFVRHIVLQYHGSNPEALFEPENKRFRLATRALVRRLDALLLLSQEELRQWRRFAPALPAFVVQNPFVAEFTGTPPPPPADWGLKDGQPVVLFVGRFIEEKGGLDLIRALPLVLKQQDCRLLLVGGGDAEPAMRELVEHLGVGDQVTFAGYLTGETLWTAYDAGTILALPTYFGEGYPTVFSEAMSRGLPIITTAIRGAVDELQEGVHTLFVPVRDPAALAAAIIRLLSDTTLRHQLSENNRRKVAEFAPPAVARRYLDAVERATGRR